MNDVFWIICCVIGTIFLIFIAVLAIIDMWIRNKPKKKYYLIKYGSCIYNYEIVIKAKNSLEARLKFQKKHPDLKFVSIEEIEDE